MHNLLHFIIEIKMYFMEIKLENEQFTKHFALYDSPIHRGPSADLKVVTRKCHGSKFFTKWIIWTTFPAEMCKP